MSCGVMGVMIGVEVAAMMIDEVVTTLAPQHRHLGMWHLRQDMVHRHLAMVRHHLAMVRRHQAMVSHHQAVELYHQAMEHHPGMVRHNLAMEHCLQLMGQRRREMVRRQAILVRLRRCTGPHHQAMGLHPQVAKVGMCVTRHMMRRLQATVRLLILMGLDLAHMGLRQMVKVLPQLRLNGQHQAHWLCRLVGSRQTTHPVEGLTFSIGHQEKVDGMRQVEPLHSRTH